VISSLASSSSAPPPNALILLGRLRTLPVPYRMMAMDQLFHDVFRLHPSRARSELRDIAGSDEGGSSAAAARNQQPLPPVPSRITASLTCEKRRIGEDAELAGRSRAGVLWVPAARSCDDRHGDLCLPFAVAASTLAVHVAPSGPALDPKLFAASSATASPCAILRPTTGAIVIGAATGGDTLASCCLLCCFCYC
jgi:hypothetical protein